ncbi:hypothetical protein FB45DRAFT_916972 [Roridomyces roridus]|uniref:Uncharacterized protein n=1 Tax=Roridomyces roridus TaxID=1738132 RepID=A0AAD7BVH6_9AGAR|nr:hypothetical protein FB45DRAFT_916972 [Roridomyces roridus]
MPWSRSSSRPSPFALPSSHSCPLRLVMRSHVSELRLSCTMPTWSSSSDHCMSAVLSSSNIDRSTPGLDLHDLHELRAVFIVFIHEIVKALRSSGVNASYVLVPSNSSRCVILAGRCNELASAVSILQNTPLEKLEKDHHQVLLADVGSPCLVIT